jgi:hypothetical protein
MNAWLKRGGLLALLLLMTLPALPEAVVQDANGAGTRRATGDTRGRPGLRKEVKAEDKADKEQAASQDDGKALVEEPAPPAKPAPTVKAKGK